MATGRIELICGPMFSGKTTALIARLVAARDSALETIAVKPELDTRYGQQEIVSHDGAAHRAVNVRDAGAIRGAAGRSVVVGIDEVHFFDESVVGACRDLTAAGTRVIAAGVEIDHRGRPFETVRLSIEIANEVTRLTAICTRCGAAARHSQRLIPGDARLVVGGAGAYEPRCDQCSEPGL
jgi:thymidine kinase